MEFFDNIKRNVYWTNLEDDDTYNLDLYISKLKFNVNNKFRYIGFNPETVDYSKSYLVREGGYKQQLNADLCNSDVKYIYCLNDTIILTHNNNRNSVYCYVNYPILNFINNLVDIYNKDTIVHLFKLIFCCKRRYRYYKQNIIS